METNGIPAHRPLMGKLAIVTGGSRGIGQAIAHHLARKGANLVIGYHQESSEEAAADTASRLQKAYGITAVPICKELSVPSGAPDLIAQAKQLFTDPHTGEFQIDIIVNNAGVAKMAALGDITLDDDILPQYSVNVFAPLFLVQAALPYLPHDRSGRIVNISSTSSSNGCAEQSVYGATKAALEAMTRTWSRELAERATVNAINPGPVLTDMFQGTSRDFRIEISPMVELAPLMRLRHEVDGEKMMRDWAPMRGRPAYLEEVAAIVGMICGSDSGWCTGSVVNANGGMQFVM